MSQGLVEYSKHTGFRVKIFELWDDHKDYVYSWKRRDRPYAVMVRTENMNNSSDDTGGGVKDLGSGTRCGKERVENIPSFRKGVDGL